MESRKVLVVNDDLEMLKANVEMLRQLGFTTIDEANGSSAAFEQLKGNSYDLVLIDLDETPTAGIDCLKAIRSGELTKSLPVIMVFDLSERENIVAAAQAGASDYLIKPITSDVLAEKINKIL